MKFLELQLNPDKQNISLLINDDQIVVYLST